MHKVASEVSYEILNKLHVPKAVDNDQLNQPSLGSTDHTRPKLTSCPH
jgi:hypothetical protein